VALLAGLILAGASGLRAQGGGGTIEGRVADSQQLAIAHATVELKDAQGRGVQTIVADGTGYYIFSGVPAGTYTLTFSSPGFEPGEQGSVAVSGGQTTAVDAILRPSAVIENVTVAAEIDRSIATKTEIPANEVPVTVQTVPLEVIQRQNLTDLVSVVNNTPGSYALTQYGVYNYFYFRGFALTKDPGSAVLLNGLRVEGNRINTQINSIESVEIVKGPSSMLYGTEALGGMISIVQKKPLSTPLYEVAFHAGRWGTRGAELGVTGPMGTGNLLGRLDVAFARSDGFRQAGYEQLNLTPAVYWRVSPSDQLNFHLTYNEDRYDLDAGLPLVPDASTADFPLRYTTIPNVSLETRYNTPGNFEKAIDPVFQTTYQRTFTENVRLRQAFQYQYRSDEYWQSEGLTVFFANPTSVVRENLYFNHFDNALLTQTDLLADFTAGVRHQFLAGYEYDRLSHRTRRSAAATNASNPDIDLFNPVETATVISSFPASRYDVSRNQSSAIYFQDYMHLHERVQFLVSGRFDAYDRRTQRGLATPVEFDQNPFTYRVAVNAQVAPQVSLYTSYGTSFTAQTGLSVNGDPLDPETGWQYEAGTRLNLLQDRVTVNASAYRMVRENIVVFRGANSFDQGGRQTSSGFEVEIRGRASQRLSMFANYGFTQARFDDFIASDFDVNFDEFFVDVSGRTPPHVPRHTMRIWGTYQFPRGFGASLGTRYVSRRAADQFNYFFLDGYTIWDAGFYYRRSNMEYGVNIKNFGNKKNYFVSSIIWNGNQLYPGPPIDVTATIRFRFQ
jgi:iron complex outermembrane receptor protein